MQQPYARQFISAVMLVAVVSGTGCRRVVLNSQAERYFDQPNQVRMARAIEAEDTGEIKHLIASGAVKANDFREANENIPQYSFLCFAVEFDRKRSMQALLENGASPNARTPEGISPMSVAAASADDSLLPALVAAGGDINIRGRTNEPLTFDAFNADRFKNLNYLLDHGVDLNAQDTKQDTLLNILADVNAYGWMLEVLRRGADPKIPKRGQTYLVGYTVQSSARRVTPEGEKLRQQVIRELEARGISFPVPPPPTWDAFQHKFVQR